ncbi:hypothetical protein Tco_0876238 [Tanacetum coccineum]|uniref:Uncharacterized protein n=1 Tax=Tanacetum coccineum TaxID=301880 RepID=A0ABQ5BUN3_9ASTR
MSRFSSNDMVHNHYLEEAKKKTQERDRNSRPSVMPSAKSQSTANDSKPKPRINNQKSRNWPASKIGLRWVPTRNIFTSSTTKVDSEPTNGSDEDITNQYEYEQTLDVSSGTLNLSVVMTSDHNSSELGIHDHSNEPSSSKLVSKVVPPADTTTRVGITIPQSHNNDDINISYALSWKTLSRRFYESTYHRIHKDGDGEPHSLESDSLNHYAHAQTTKSIPVSIKDSRIMKAQEFKDKDFTQTLIYKIYLQRYQVYQGRIVSKLSR